MENELSEVVQQPISTIGSFATLDAFKELYDIGKMFASSSLVPDTYQGTQTKTSKQQKQFKSA